jgi:hypothetical protein
MCYIIMFVNSGSCSKLQTRLCEIDDQPGKLYLFLPSFIEKRRTTFPLSFSPSSSLALQSTLSSLGNYKFSYFMVDNQDEHKSLLSLLLMLLCCVVTHPLVLVIIMEEIDRVSYLPIYLYILSLVKGLPC